MKSNSKYILLFLLLAISSCKPPVIYTINPNNQEEMDRKLNELEQKYIELERRLKIIEGKYGEITEILLSLDKKLTILKYNIEHLRNIPNENNRYQIEILITEQYKDLNKSIDSTLRYTDIDDSGDKLIEAIYDINRQWGRLEPHIQWVLMTIIDDYNRKAGENTSQTSLIYTDKKQLLESIDTIDILNYKGEYGPIYTLRGFERFSNLTSLTIDNHKITDFKELRKLSKLEFLRLNNGSLSTLSDIKKRDLPELKELICEKNNLCNLSGIQSLKKLERINITENPNLNDIYALVEYRSIYRRLPSSIILDCNQIGAKYFRQNLPEIKNPCK